MVTSRKLRRKHLFRVSGGVSSRSLAEEQEAVRGNGSSVGESSGAAKGGSNVNSAGEVLVSMLCWNVAGWAKGGQGRKDRSVKSKDFRAKVINFFQPDVACLVETWLKDDEKVDYDGYCCFGHNRSCLSERVRWCMCVCQVLLVQVVVSGHCGCGN